jgi:glycosyltransferase involved in cell wall biosynthesis
MASRENIKQILNVAVEQQLPISVCIIAGNEAHRITPTLESVKGWTGEIIVVINNDVNDGTDKIAGTFGAKVFREPWKGNIAQNQSATDKATSDWILSLDADEVVSPELRVSIERLFSQPEKLNRFVAYDFPRCTLYYDRWIRHGEWYPDRKLRLWRCGKGHWGGVFPHGRVLVAGAVGRLNGEILHCSMESMEHMLQKGIRYACEFAETCRKENRRITIVHLLVRPPWRFLRGYVFKLGFLDGWRGLSIAWMAAFYTFLRYFKAFEAQNSKAPVK